MAIRPKLRPKDDEFKKIVAAANSGGGDSAAPAAKGGKGGGKSVNPLAKEGSADYKKMQKANTDNSYGYYDVNTGDYVPWYIDIQNGGGMNTAGPTFEGGFGTARLAGGLLNAAGVSPYGQDRPRPFMPMEAYRGGDDKPAPFDYRSGASAAPAPTGVIDAVGGDRSTVTPVNPYAVGGGFDVTAPPMQTNPYGVGGGFDVTAPLQRVNPYGVGGGFGVTAPPAPQMAGPIMAGHNLPPIQGAGPSEQALRERAIQTYGDLFLNLTPPSQQAIMRGIAQGMANAN